MIYEHDQMKTIVSPHHSLHALDIEFSAGRAQPCFEKPSRVDMVIKQIRERELGEILQPNKFPLKHITQVHTPDYIDFLETCWAEWEACFGPENNAMASVFFRPDQRHRIPKHIEGKLGFYSGDLTAGLGPHSWEAIRSSVDSALTGADCILQGERAAFSLCRPAGHHASGAQMAGYCYVNNAAVVAQYFQELGKEKVAILDVDYHHGNGTQSIFYERDDVYFASIHGDPNQEYPYYLGHADEIGSGVGEGFNLNIPLPLGATGWADYRRALEICLEKLASYDPDVLVVSLGVDTYENDPISHFKLQSEDFSDMGRLIESAKIPTLFVFEGGYGVESLGLNTVNVLDSFKHAASR
jgi:acetoin utilization deacetylase AcuC-like enzyme|tara:strand:- start:977 stop:2041 length:1065 start_codon:yes stop_codon:yes gene_type:complete